MRDAASLPDPAVALESEVYGPSGFALTALRNWNSARFGFRWGKPRELYV